MEEGEVWRRGTPLTDCSQDCLREFVTETEASRTRAATALSHRSPVALLIHPRDAKGSCGINSGETLSSWKFQTVFPHGHIKYGQRAQPARRSNTCDTQLALSPSRPASKVDNCVYGWGQGARGIEKVWCPAIVTTPPPRSGEIEIEMTSSPPPEVTKLG